MSCAKPTCNKALAIRSKYCEDHKRKSKLCQEPECKKGAVGSTDYCKAHGGGKRCKELGCKTSAQGSTDYCKAHGGGKRCKELGCKTSAREPTDYCAAHGGGKRCKESGCKTSAQGSTDYCKAHGGGKRCQESGCEKSAREPTDYCKAHGGGKRCKESECKKSAVGSIDYCIAHGGGKRCKELGCKTSAQGSTDYCKAHGGGKRCPNCIDWIDSRSGQLKYDGYCATCFKRVFPNDPRSKVIYEHTKEIRVRNTINTNFEGFVHDKPLYTGNCDCTHRRRLDHRKLIGNTILAIETDEYGHASYDSKDEEIRYDDLYMIHSGKWIFIRFNPDRKDLDYEDNERLLLDEIENQIKRIENEENIDILEIVKLY